MLAAAMFVTGLSASTLPGAGGLNLRPDVIAPDRDVVLGELIDVSALPVNLRADAAQVPVARFRAGQKTMRLTATDVQERILVRAPALKAWLNLPSTGVVNVRLEGRDAVSGQTQVAPVDAKPGTCVRLLQPLAKYAIPTSNDLAPTACPGCKAPIALAYDASNGVMRATRGIRVDETVAAPPAFAIPVVRPGQHLFIKTRLGPVVVERDVSALQAGRPGEALFVKAGDHDIFAVTLAGGQP